MRKNRNLKNNTSTQNKSLQSVNDQNRNYNYEIGSEIARRTPYGSGLNSTREYGASLDDFNERNYIEEYGSDYERRNSEVDYNQNIGRSNTNTEFAEENCCGQCEKNRRK